MAVPVSILDLAFIPAGGTAAEAYAGSVALAQRAESLGYRRIWYAEHHNIPSIASSATSVLIAHVAAQTRTIRLGAGGIMLPNHAPLVIAEQFGTLATLHPGRIDLGLGRAPGTDPVTSRALRITPMEAEDFPSDVLELQGYLGDRTRVAGVEATPGKATHVPLYILGSSLFGAQLAARLGLPYAFASHFAPGALVDAVQTYRRDFRPSEQLGAPYVIAGMNVLAAGSRAEAEAQLRAVQRSRVRVLVGRGQAWTDEECDEVLESPAGQHVRGMTKYAAIGEEGEVKLYLEQFAALARADEIMTVHPAPTVEARLRSVEILARAAGSDAAVSP
ncbi:MAG TPA: LLM class flavin-dependent oxidoreductase [Polyangiaceae bacterium]|jgi:luciferase family oxidoreductase group 1